MKIKYLLIASLVILSGCSQSAETTNADNGMIEATSIERVLTASDVHLTDQYQFAINDQVVEGIDTYSGPVSISTDDQVELIIYGSDQPIDEFIPDQPLENQTFIAEVAADGKATTTYTFDEEEQYEYYRIIASEECDIVVAVA